MNILPIKKINFKFVALSVVVVILAVLDLWSHFKSASGAQGDPEAQMQDLSGNQRASFSIDESGYLNARAYSESIPGYIEKLDIVLAVDVSNSMCNPTCSKLDRAKDFVKSFADGIAFESDVYLGMVSFDDTPHLNSNLVAISNEAARNNFKNLADHFSVGGIDGTDIGGAITTANNILIKGRANATKYIILVSDGAECCETIPTFVWLNGGLFGTDWVNNINAGVQPGTALQTSIDNSIRFRSVYINRDGSNDCSYNPDIIPRVNGGLLRFIAARTNKVLMPAGITRWDVDFGQATGIDDQLFFIFASDNIFEIYGLIEGMTGVKLKYFTKLAPQAQFETLYSAIDKGGRNRPVTLTEISPGLYKIVTDGPLAYTYRCASFETACRNNAVLHDDGFYWIENNYLDLKIKVKFTGLGVFDLLSNYIGCESGPLKQVGQDSRVEYYDPRNNEKYKTLYFKSVCVRVAESSPLIIKTSYTTDPGDDLANTTGVRQASFDAGDDIFVVLEIDDSTSGRTDFIIEDALPASVSGAIEYSFYHGSNKVKTGEVSASDSRVFFKGQENGGSGEVIGALSSGKNYIKYRFKI